MRVVVFGERGAEREAVSRALLRGGVHAEAIGDPKAAVQALGREPAQAVVVAWPGPEGCKLLQLLRGADASGLAYVIVVFDAQQPGRDVAAALAAGAHDFIRRPLVDEDLVARVRAPERLCKWSKARSKSDVVDWSSGVDLRALRTWRELGAIVVEDLAQIVGEPMDPVEGWPKRLDRCARAATIPMSLASERVELRVSIVADGATLQWLAGALLGDPKAPAAAQDDILRELANTAGGAVKRAALPENVTLTTGIPINEAAFKPPAEGRAWALSLQRGAGCIAVVAEVRRRENLRIPADQLREGMVLVADLRNESGALLVSAGTRLTSTTAERVANVLGARFVVEVACAA